MTMPPLRLTVADEEVWNLTLEAMAATEGLRPTLALRCQACGSKLAAAGVTPIGPVFTSAWDVELPLGHAVYVNGVKLPRRATLKFDQKMFEVVERRGRPQDHIGRDGVVALLVVPPHMPQEYPDLLVRCNDHGDVLLDRLQVLTWIRDGRTKSRKVAVRLPHREYDRGRAGGTKRRSRETRRFRPRR